MKLNIVITVAVFVAWLTLFWVEAQTPQPTVGFGGTNNLKTIAEIVPHESFVLYLTNGGKVEVNLTNGDVVFTNCTPTDSGKAFWDAVKATYTK